MSVFTTTGNILWIMSISVTRQIIKIQRSCNLSSGNITVQNGSSFDGDNSGNNQSNGLQATTGGTGSITISDTTFTDSKKNGNHANGATLSAPTITLTNVISNNNDKI